MSKKILGLVVSVALLMVVLSGCFLLPQIDTFTPVIKVISPTANQTITVPTSTSSTNVTATASVVAHSPLQSVLVSLSKNGQVLVNNTPANGNLGQNTGVFSYTFTNLTPGTYTVQFQAYSSAKNPGIGGVSFTVASAQAVTPPSTKYKAPVVSLINVLPNYTVSATKGYYVTGKSVNFSASVSNPNSVGYLSVWAKITGPQNYSYSVPTVTSTNSAYNFTGSFTPTATGNYTINVYANVTVGASVTVTTSQYVGISVLYPVPSVTNISIPNRLAIVNTSSETTTGYASFTFKATGVNAYLTINNSSPATYTSQSPIANSKLNPNVWNTLTLTFKDPWGNLLPQYTTVATVLGLPHNLSQVPSIFLIDKYGHVITTNDWISEPAGYGIDLYGYINNGTQHNYSITEQYCLDENLTPMSPSSLFSGVVASATNLNSSITPLRIKAYLFNPQTGSKHSYIIFSANINNLNSEGTTFLRYDIEPAVPPVITLNVAQSNTQPVEGVPATITVVVNSNPLSQPLTQIVLGQPSKVASPFINYPTSATQTSVAYNNSQNNNSNTMTFEPVSSSAPFNYMNNYRYIAPVSQVTGPNSYGFVTGGATYNVAFYGPANAYYSIGATVTDISNLVATTTTQYKIQADTGNPKIKAMVSNVFNLLSNDIISNLSTPSNNFYVYAGPMTVNWSVQDDHAIYWANLSYSSTPYWAPVPIYSTLLTYVGTTLAYYPNNKNISNYGVTNISTQSNAVEFPGKIGIYKIYPFAGDKHFNPSNYVPQWPQLSPKVYWYGNLYAQQPPFTIVYSSIAPEATAVGGQYNESINTEEYGFAVSASDTAYSSDKTMSYQLLSPTALIKLVPIGNSSAVSTIIVAPLTTHKPLYGTYMATIDTYNLTNFTQYKVMIGVKDKIYDAVAQELAEGLIDPISAQILMNQHITWVNWGVITVDLVYPNVALSAGVTYNPLPATPTTVSTTVFRVDINNDPFFPWGQFAENNYNQLLNYINVQVGNTTNGFNNSAYVIPLKVTQTSTQSGYFLFAVPGLYQNVGTTNAVATQTIQVSVYNSTQPSKAIFGQVVRTVAPQAPFSVSISGAGVAATSTGSASTPYINPTFTYSVPITISGLVGSQSGMNLIFMVNGTPTMVVNPAANGTYNIPVPTPAGTTLTSVRVLYSPTYYAVPGAAKVSVQSFTIPSGYQYYRYFSTLYTLGDNITPTSSITLNGVNINGATKVVTTPFNYTYYVNGVLFYLHDLAVTTKFATGNNTTINGLVTFSSYSTSTTTLASPTLKATSLLGSVGFAQGNKWTISKVSKTFSMPGVYTVNFKAFDPKLGNTTVLATVAVDPFAPVISGITLNGNSVSNVTSGVVPTIANGNVISAVATDYAGVQSAKISVLDLIDNAATSYAMTNHFGLGAFTATVSATVTLPAVFAPQYQNLPYEVTFYATNIANLGANPVTRLFVTNVDHSPKILNIKAVAANQAVVTLSEPMWVNGFKAFVANSATYGGTITSTNIAPTTVLASYQGAQIAAQFTVTFGYNIWGPSQVGNSVFSDLSNVELSSSVSSYVPIVDLAGNVFTMPINTTTPPTLFVTPSSTVVGKGWNVTFTVNATSAAGIKEVVGSFNGQTKYVYAPTGSMTFVAPTVAGTYTASFKAVDESVNQNTTTVTALVYVNTAAPTLKLTAQATVGSNQSFLATATVKVGDDHGNNKIVSVKIGGVNATLVSSSTWKATVTLSGNGPTTLTAVATDLYGNSASVSTPIYVDGQAPTITLNFATSPTAVYFPSGNGTVNLTQTSTKATVYLYYGTGPSTTVYGVVNDNSNYEVSVISTYDSVTLHSTSAKHVPQYLHFNLVGGKTTFTASAADMFGNKVKYTVTYIATQDTTAPTVSFNASPANYHGANWAASPTIVASYSANDNAGGSGLKNGEVKFYLASFKGTTTSFTTMGGTNVKTPNLIPYFENIGIVNKSATEVKLTIAATDNVGNTTKVSTTWTVRLKFSILSTGTTKATITNGQLLIPFNVPANGTLPASSDVYLYNSTNGKFTAYNFHYTPGATEIVVSTVQQNGVTYSVGGLPSGTYSLYVSGVETVNNIPLSNGNGEISLTK